MLLPFSDQFSSPVPSEMSEIDTADRESGGSISGSSFQIPASLLGNPRKLYNVCGAH